jgi:hypothetical protein
MGSGDQLHFLTFTLDGGEWCWLLYAGAEPPVASWIAPEQVLVQTEKSLSVSGIKSWFSDPQTIADSCYTKSLVQFFNVFEGTNHTFQIMNLPHQWKQEQINDNCGISSVITFEKITLWNILKIK